MKRLTGPALEQHTTFFEAAAKIAANATCLRAKCGAVIVKNGEIIGDGSNHPPHHDETQRMCHTTWDYSKKPKYDLTCCVHAEWAAVIDTCKHNDDAIVGSTLYFMRIDDKGNFTEAGDPYCMTCSRFAMEAGVAYFALWNGSGMDLYEIAEYNKLSYKYYS